MLPRGLRGAFCRLGDRSEVLYKLAEVHPERCGDPEGCRDAHGMPTALHGGEVGSVHSRDVARKLLHRKLSPFAGCAHGCAEHNHGGISRGAGRHRSEAEKRTPRAPCRTPHPVPREVIPSHTLGIDLASQAKQTGVCLLDWTATPATVLDHGSHALDDQRLLELMTDPQIEKIGIDAPFAWPLAFVDALSTYRDHGTWLGLAQEDMRFRATEVVVADVTGQAPLSVATSDLAWPAMRVARLLTSLAATEGPIDRAGAGRVAEVYPAAALRRWGVVPAGTSVLDAAYKTNKSGRENRRRTMMTSLRLQLAGQVDVDDATFDRCVSNDDDLDAFVSALVARAVQIGQSEAIPHSLRWAAMREGWIHLPLADSLERLAG